MTANLNKNPYYDDFDSSKNYVQVLFKPSVPVQARELTQIQSILRNQISLIGSYVFGGQVLISGGSVTRDVLDSYGWRLSSANFSFNVEDYIGFNVTNGTSTGILRGVDNGRIYIDGPNFAVGDVLSFGSNLNTIVVEDHINNDGIRVNIDAGEFFTEFGIVTIPQTNEIIFDTTGGIDGVLGYSMNCSFISVKQDPTLKNPAKGVYGFSSEGADRLQVVADAIYYDNPADAVADENFVELVSFTNGTITSVASDYPYSGIRSSYETINGNYSFTNSDFVGNVVKIVNSGATLTIPNGVYGNEPVKVISATGGTVNIVAQSGSIISLNGNVSVSGNGGQAELLSLPNGSRILTGDLE